MHGETSACDVDSTRSSLPRMSIAIFISLMFARFLGAESSIISVLIQFSVPSFVSDLAYLLEFERKGHRPNKHNITTNSHTVLWLSRLAD